MNSLLSTIGAVVAIAFSICSIIISIINLVQTKKGQIINGITQNRLLWIRDVRAMTMEFMEMFNQQRPVDELETQMYKIQLYMRDGVKSYSNMIDAMEKCCYHSSNENRKELLRELTIASQEVLSEVWRRTKYEAGMGKKMDNKYSDISIISK